MVRMADRRPHNSPTTDELEQQLRAVLEANDTPAWVKALLSLVMQLLADLRAENERLRAELRSSTTERRRRPRTPNA